MFAIVRTGGKQYRVAEGDKIAVEKLAGEAGETVVLDDVLLAGEGEALSDAGKVTVSAEIIAQAKSEKIVVFKKKRRHNYRRKAGHRQQLTLLRIIGVGDGKPAAKKAKAAEPAANDVATKAKTTTVDAPAKAPDQKAAPEKTASKADEPKKAAPKKGPVETPPESGTADKID